MSCLIPQLFTVFPLTSINISKLASIATAWQQFLLSLHHQRHKFSTLSISRAARDVLKGLSGVYKEATGSQSISSILSQRFKEAVQTKPHFRHGGHKHQVYSHEG